MTTTTITTTSQLLLLLRVQLLQFPLYSSFVKNSRICFLCCPRNPQNLSQSFRLKGVEVCCFFILSESPAFTAVYCRREFEKEGGRLTVYWSVNRYFRQRLPRVDRRV